MEMKLMNYFKNKIKLLFLNKEDFLLLEAHRILILEILSLDAIVSVESRINTFLNSTKEKYKKYFYKKKQSLILATIKYIEKNIESNQCSKFIYNKLQENNKLFNLCIEEIAVIFLFFDFEQDDDFFIAIFNHVKKFYLESIKIYCIENNVKIAFFSPGKSFRGNFGLIESFLNSKSVFLFGDIVGDEAERQVHAFLVIDEMLRNLNGIKMFVIPTVMNSLPETSIKFLIEHASLAYFAPPVQEGDGIQKNIDTTDQRRYFHLMDYITVTSVKAQEFLRDFSNLLGFHEARNNDNKISKENSICLIPGGYPKYDQMLKHVEKYKNAKKNTIIYAPTPNDKSGNKDLWLPYMSVNSHSKIILSALCEAFPDLNIVFKPHNDDYEDLIKDINDSCKRYSNYKLDESGSNYFNLYANSFCMVSDFSSTAFTYALSTNCPVVFFSHNEVNLITNLKLKIKE